MADSKGVYALRHVIRRRHDDRGAAAVEFALLFPIFMILAMGIINGGLAFSRQINVTQAAREASRYGGTYDIKTAGGITKWLQAVDNAAQQSAGNAANPIGGYDYRCVALLVRDATDTVDATNSRYLENGTTSGSGSCPTTATPNLGANSKVVQVVLSRNVQFFVVFINPTLHLDAVSLTPYEWDLP